jgi:hypothetical protein
LITLLIPGSDATNVGLIRLYLFEIAGWVFQAEFRRIAFRQRQGWILWAHGHAQGIGRGKYLSVLWTDKTDFARLRVDLAFDAIWPLGGCGGHRNSRE